MRSLFKLSFTLAALLLLASCSSVRVASDYDRGADFSGYKSYAFYKTGIDKAMISDLDKKRILRAIDGELNGRGFVKSENPDLLISIFTTEKDRVDIYANSFGWGWGWGWGWGYNPWFWGPGAWNYGPAVTTNTEGTLYIDLIDAATRELVWQGKGTGILGNNQNMEKKEERIQDFVSRILERYPPEGIALK
ncbi:DUF4136 domain-containing protein [Robiginitalea sp. SC105]|uniref:DUF4136 domain-containing protein n=1 Tax=Robiginitalea sp. SC105 TaxID=2762332 RepID=UPI001639B017|nr:DUF4136 domain-containing protein [Robiginitalea sp. SC105]MBC2837722.1 DUF4136 domain-containing protein [Robiginitalea sp. SC105]